MQQRVIGTLRGDPLSSPAALGAFMPPPEEITVYDDGTTHPEGARIYTLDEVG